MCIRDRGTSIGFGAEVRNIEDKKIGEWMKNLEPEDLLKYGLIPEFIGRLPIIATLEDLDVKSLIKILLEPKNSLVKQYQELFKIEGAKLSFKDNAIKEIAEKAISKKTGARGLRSILENILLTDTFLTSVGYGTQTPSSITGKAIGGFCAIVGVFILTLPVPIVVNSFASYYKNRLWRNEVSHNCNSFKQKNSTH